MINDAMIEAAVSAYNHTMDSHSQSIKAALVAALPLILEEVAKVADEHRTLLHHQTAVIDIGREDAAYSIIATAIRAMGEKANG